VEGTAMLEFQGTGSFFVQRTLRQGELGAGGWDNKGKTSRELS